MVWGAVGRPNQNNNRANTNICRTKSTYKNLVLIRGSIYDSPSVMLSGHLVVSLPEQMSVKKISLFLRGRYKLDFLEVLEHSKNTISNPVKEESIIFETVWDNLLVSPDGEITIGNNSEFEVNRDNNLASAIGGASTRSFKRVSNTSGSLHLPESQSGTPFENVAATSGTSFVLPAGNYELPFKCKIPGDIPETIEGLLAGSILYKFEAVIERGSFKAPIQHFKYFRIFRTLSSDNMLLSETMSIGKSWPNKVQYEVSIPSRAVAIGGVTPINILLVPLAKGLKLGLIKAQVVQYYAFKGETGDLYDDEQVILDCNMREMENKELIDKLQIESFINIPSNLKKVTQDCDFKNDLIKVRHKLKLQINLINSNGHISELRANLPIHFFISPNVAMTGRKIVLDKHGKIHFRKEEEKLFESVRQGGALLPDRENNSNNLTLVTDDAPPNYDEHFFDKIIDTNDSRSGNTNAAVVSTPRPVMRHIQDFDSYFDIPTNNDVSNPVSPLLQAPVVVPASRAPSLLNGAERLDYENISAVPTYQDTMEGEDDPNPSDDFSPVYFHPNDSSSTVNSAVTTSEENNAKPLSYKQSSVTNLLTQTLTGSRSSSTSNLSKLVAKRILK